MTVTKKKRIKKPNNPQKDMNIFSNIIYTNLISIKPLKPKKKITMKKIKKKPKNYGSHLTVFSPLKNAKKPSQFVWTISKKLLNGQQMKENLKEKKEPFSENLEHFQPRQKSQETQEMSNIKISKLKKIP